MVVPALGGTDEYAVHRENALIVDTSQLEACYEAGRELVDDRNLRERLQRAGVATAGEYSIERAAHWVLTLFANALPGTEGELVGSGLRPLPTDVGRRPP